MVLSYDDLTAEEKKRLDADNIQEMLNIAEYRLDNGFCSYSEKMELKKQICEYQKMLDNITQN